MPETGQPDPIEDTKRALNALVARVYDSQKKAGLFLEDEIGEMMAEDFTDFFAELHLKVSGAYEAYKHGDQENDSGVGHLLADITLTCLGLCYRFGHDVGKLLLDLVVSQAQEAAELERERKAEDAVQDLNLQSDEESEDGEVPQESEVDNV